MKIRLSFTPRTNSLKHSVYIGTLDSYGARMGFGFGVSYFEDGEFDLGMILGKSTVCIEFLWGDAKYFYMNETSA